MTGPHKSSIRLAVASLFLDYTERVFRVMIRSEDHDVQQLTASLNDKIRAHGSQARVDDLIVEYIFHLTRQDTNTLLDFIVVLTGNIANYVIAKDQFTTIMDLGWRGLGSNESVRGPCVGRSYD